jgi:branched-chain amino acid transport system substrate-binding protein
MTRDGRRIAAIAVATLQLLCIGGCSDDAASSTGANVITLGVFIREGGDSADEILAVRQINAAGGITLGDTSYTLELVREYDGASAGGGADAVERFAEQGAVAAIGPRWSSILLGEEPDFDDGAAQAAIDRDMILISGNTTSAAISALDDDDLVWRTIPSDEIQGEGCARYAYEQRDVRTAAILYRDDAWGRGLSERFTMVFEQLGGTVQTSVAFEPDIDLTGYAFPELDEVFAEQPQLVFLLAFNESPQITHRVVQGGHLEPYGEDLPLFMATDGSYDPNILINGAPEVLPRLLGTLPGPPPSNPIYSDYLDEFEGEGLGPKANAWPYPYDAIYVLALAIQAAQSTDSEEIKAQLREVSRDDGDDDVEVLPNQWAKGREALLDGKNVDYRGASGPIDFDEAGDPGAGFYSLWEIVRQDDGSFAIEFDDDSTVEFGPEE